MVVVDADVVIEVLRKNPVVASYLRNDIGAFNIVLSAVTIAEIQQGATSKENLQQINRLLKQYIILPIEYQISNIFSTLVQKYVLSHDTDIGDTFVAATALHYQLPLLTMNLKHYKHIPNLQLVKHNLIPLQGKGHSFQSPME
jgi:predicted nucleic acid-binding protein